MISAGVKDVKNNLSRLLARVRAGEVVVITDRGRPVARIVKEDQQGNAVREALLPLVERGLIALPNHSVLKDQVSALKVPGKPVSEMVIEDRR
ncbi:MAG: type II toxin-antitoxin system prevent-host-death family antitoxin [Deltaproteobacteria bacterium]|nr:type II toxin-antitoxin system prevent-host-death family antitoxin [Deltaproteobacteria bacterium]